ncbi:MAG: isoprenylcysteine carboxylmethyltransferase family protein [Rhodobacterales bacterium]|nr:MAG: isoprenylcysteine carboxylmethyltransferase family protein [Rhodobacterales bacterium]
MPYGEFYLGGATGQGFSPEWEANRTVLAWAHFSASASGVTLLGSAAAYDAGSIIVGTLLSAWCLYQLGKSFSMMAVSRELKTQGSYSIVRHPLYGAEVVMILGFILSHGSVLAFGVGAIWLLLQIRRAQYEESVLRKTFPEYADYARRVPMLIPGLHLRFLEKAAAPADRATI